MLAAGQRHLSPSRCPLPRQETAKGKQERKWPHISSYLSSNPHCVRHHWFLERFYLGGRKTSAGLLTGLPGRGLTAHDTMDQWTLGLGQGLRDPVAGPNQTSGFFQSIRAVVVERAEQFALCYFVARLLVQDDSHGMVYAVFFALASAAEHQAGDANLLAIHCGHVPGFRTGNVYVVLCLGQQREIIEGFCIAVLQTDDL